MRSAGAASFTPVTVAVFSTWVFRVANITHLRRTFWVVTLKRGTRGMKLGGHLEQ
jgi:hypothetical protein